MRPSSIRSAPTEHSDGGPTVLGGEDECVAMDIDRVLSHLMAFSEFWPDAAYRSTDCGAYHTREPRSLLCHRPPMCLPRGSSESRCGGRSAYSRPGGATPYCYVADVPAAEITRYRARQGSDSRRQRNPPNASQVGGE